MATKGDLPPSQRPIREMSEYELAGMFSELISAEEHAFAVLAGSIGDVIGADRLATALGKRLAKAQAAESHPMRDRLLETAVRTLRGT